MRKCRITVYDYSDKHYNKDNPLEVKRFDVEAFCVGGDEGVRAYFYQGDLLYEADGDDGHWWLGGVISCGWIKEMIEALRAVEEEHQTKIEEIRHVSH